MSISGSLPSLRLCSTRYVHSYFTTHCYLPLHSNAAFRVNFPHHEVRLISGCLLPSWRSYICCSLINPFIMPSRSCHQNSRQPVPGPPTMQDESATHTQHHAE